MLKERTVVGDWVQIENVVLPSGKRAPQVPTDTQAVPLIMRVKGFALTEGSLGEQIKIKTVIGREVEGNLVEIDPFYAHDFGRPVPELLKIGITMRSILNVRTNTKSEIRNSKQIRNPKYKIQNHY